MAYTTISNPSAHFKTILYSGDGSSSQSITGVGFQPDFSWIKERTDSSGHHLFNSNIGYNKALFSHSTATESDQSMAVASDGYTLGSSGGFNENSQTYVGWNWKAGGTSPSQTYKVVVVSDSGNKYRFRNSADNATYAASAVTVDLQEGGTYTFDQSDSSNSGHPLRFSTTSNGTHGGGSEYTTNVTTNGTPGSSGAYTRITVAASAPTLYYYCTQHSGMGGQINTNSTFGSTNFDGSTLSKVTANTTAGFSIATWTGTGANATVGHGLGSAPQVVLVKCRSNTGDWMMFHTGLGNNAKTLSLNTNGQETTESSPYYSFNNTAPTSTVFSLGAGNTTNGSGRTFVAYCFTSIKGYSSFGSYQGTGNANGTYIYTGFKPNWFLVKARDSTQNWQLWDSKRNASTPTPEIGNPRVRTLSPSVSNSETGDYEVDFCSTGVKIRNNDSAWNGDNNNYVYFAFAECPLVAGGVVSTGG